MIRIRVAFVVVAVVLLVPLAFLVRTALRSAEAERDLQHRVVADRIVDEMERELTTLLHREEDRPFAHYRFAYAPEPGEAPGQAWLRSPLADPPTDVFILGWFQVEPDGTVTSPLRPSPAVLAGGLPGDPPTPEAEAAAKLIETAVEGLWSGRRREEIAPDPSQETQIPGSTVPLPKKQAATPRSGGPAQAAEEAKPEKAPERYLEQLNRAVSLRGERQEKMSQVQSINLDADALAAPQPTVDVRLEPMIGQPLAPGYMVLYRTVLAGDQAYRQGLIIDLAALLAHLEQRILASGDLSGRAHLFPAATFSDTRLPDYAFRHRFADPFGPVVAILALEPLPGLGGRTWIVALSCLLAAAAVLGLLAVYRMVAVVVAYAERRNNFVSAVTHELKTPLTAIRMYGEMLRDGMVSEDSRRQRCYETITAEGERLSRLLDNVLELSRLERKARPMELRAGDIAAAVEDAVAVLRPQASRLGFDLQMETEASLPPVRFERDALRQVVFNLVDNALKYSRESPEKSVVVRCRRHGDGVAVQVADRGPGVAHRHLEHIFQPFYRGEDELTRTARGTGIGLALVRGLVERMGGRVWGRNRDGGGFEVVVLLPGAELASQPGS